MGVDLSERTRSFAELEVELQGRLDDIDGRTRQAQVHPVLIGLPPALHEDHLQRAVLSDERRYQMLDQQIRAERDEDVELSISGVERLVTFAQSIAPAAGCAGVQLREQLLPEDFAKYWNAAQAITGVLFAVAANSPFFLGRELWRETRVPVLEQTLDTRRMESKAQGNRPIVWFGERWITSPFDPFEENARFFSPLVPELTDDDPVQTLEAGIAPDLDELTLHNSTIYRWNRPLYDAVDGRPRLRLESRVLSAGPTVVDVLANAAFSFGLVTALVEQDRPIWTQLSFSAAIENCYAGAHDGLDARLYWPGAGEIPVTELILRRLLALAHDGLERRGVDGPTRERLLGIIERRCVTATNGAAWQSRMFHHLYHERKLERREALRAMTREYRELMRSRQPVHEWPVG